MPSSRLKRFRQAIERDGKILPIEVKTIRGDFAKLVVGGRGIGPLIQAAAALFRMPLIARAVEALCRDFSIY